MKLFLDTFLPRIFPSLNFQCIPHEGKKDLEKSIPRKLRAWKTPDAIFVVVIDNDGADCRGLKKKLAGLCKGAGRQDTLVRIACQELESWYLGDVDTLKKVYSVKAKVSHKQTKYRMPDDLIMPSQEIKKLAPLFQKMDGARKIGAKISYKTNKSISFQSLVSGIARISGLVPVNI